MRISGSDAIIVMDNEVWYCIDGLPNRKLWRWNEYDDVLKIKKYL